MKFIWVVVFLLLLPSIISCSEIPLGEYRIELDDYDPNLHDQIVSFEKPMRYVLLAEKHIGEYPKEDVAIGRLLSTEELVFEPGGYNKSGYLSQEIEEGMKFTVKASYWYRRDWFKREIVGDKRYLIMTDELGVESVMLFGMFIYSDKPELYELKDEGLFK